MQFPRRLMTAVTVALVALSWLTAAGTRADDFPSRVIRVVVAFPAGGPTDFVARILADRLKPLLGQNVIVENRPGATSTSQKARPTGICCFLPRSERSRSRRI
jgi:tripartite-type tricarboxylate transporter receptor subunit TctC